MSSLHSGTPRPAAGADSPSAAPGPGVAPGINVPADGDPQNAATLFTQQYTSLADHYAWLSKALQVCPPILASTQSMNLGGGYSTVAHVGSGTGTVLPQSGGSKITAGLNVVIQIQTGGATGTATFKTSTDGGATYGALQTTASSMTDATTGIIFAFSGTFVGNDTYQFHCAFAPQLALTDTAGNLRQLFDHNGFRISHTTEFREDWDDVVPGNYSMGASPPYNFGGGVNGAPVVQKTGNTKFQMNGTASVGLISASVDSTLGCKAAFLQVGASSGNKLYLQTVAPLMSNTANMVVVVQWAMRMGTVGGTNCNVYAGLFDNYTTMSASTNTLQFQSLNGANWVTWNGGTGVNTGIAPINSAMQRFRIEYHGANTPLGVLYGQAVSLFFINEQIGASNGGFTAGTGATPYIGFGLENSGAGGTTLLVSPVVATYTHYLSLPTL